MRNDLPNEKATNFSARVRETLMTYLGKSGDPLDRGITLRDLVENGIVGIFDLRAASKGGVIPLSVGDEVEAAYTPDLTPPPTPTGFTATAGVTTVTVETDDQLYTQGHGHLRTRIYGATRGVGDPNPVFADAAEIGQFTGVVNAFSSNPATEWHLWVKWESRDGVLSQPAGGTNGVVVTTSEDVTTLLDALSSELDGSGNPVNPNTLLITRASTTTINGVSVPAGVYMKDSYIQNGVITTAKIGNAAIDSAKIASAAVTTAKIADANITTAKIADANITSAKIADANITTAKIADANITTAKIADANITTAKIADAQITNAKIGNAAITSAKIADGEITNAKIANAAITAAKIGDGEITSAKIGNTISSTVYFPNLTGWIIRKDGSAEFNNVVISRQLLVDSGTSYQNPFTTNNNTLSEKYTFYVETNTASVAWSGTDKTFIALVSLENAAVNVNTSDATNRPGDIQWGYSAEVIPITRFSGNARIFLKVSVYARLTNFVSGDYNWYLYKVT